MPGNRDTKQISSGSVGGEWIHFNARGSVCTVDQPAIRLAAMVRVERDRREPLAIVGFPLVDRAVAVCVLFSADEAALAVVFDARHLAVAARGDVEFRDRAVRSEVLPRVFLAV